MGSGNTARSSYDRILVEKFRTVYRQNYGEQLLKQGYHLFFNFTINSDNTDLEPNVPPLNERLDQLEHLCQRFGSDAVNWRFDPICFFKTGQGAPGTI